LEKHRGEIGTQAVVSLHGPLADRLDECPGQSFIGEGEEGHFEFNEKGSGEFHFGYVPGHMDCRPTARDGEPAVEWTWDGNDEMEPAQGRGWAVVKGDELHGMIFFHGGNESEFVAKKKDKPASKRKTP